jgi:hypothetical protein
MRRGRTRWAEDTRSQPFDGEERVNKFILLFPCGSSLYKQRELNVMETVSPRCSDGASAPTALSRFEVSLVYQDLPTALHAKQFLNHVLDRCKLPSESSLTLWKLELFQLPEICEEAVVAACGSALVILSLRGDIGLEASTENWLEQWIGRRDDEECALAVLIDCDMQRLDSVGQTLFRLQALTRQSHIRLFAGFMPSASTNGTFPKNQNFSAAELPLATDKISSKSPEVHCEGGLNE